MIEPKNSLKKVNEKASIELVDRANLQKTELSPKKSNDNSIKKINFIFNVSFIFYLVIHSFTGDASLLRHVKKVHI